MKPIGRTAVCTVLFLVALGTALAQQVKTDFDHHANFSQYKTYSWEDIKPANSLWDARIKNAVDAQLTAKGWTQVPSGGDVCIVAIKTTQTQRSLQTFYDGFGGGWGWRSEEHTSELQSRFDLVCRLLLEKKNIIGISVSSLMKSFIV